MLNLSLKDVGLLLHISSTAVAKYEKGEIKPNTQKLNRAYSIKENRIFKVLQDSSIRMFDEEVDNLILLIEKDVVVV